MKQIIARESSFLANILLCQYIPWKKQIKTNNVLVPLLKEQFTQKIKNRTIDISYTGGHRSSYQKLLEQEKTVRGMSVYGTEST